MVSCKRAAALAQQQLMHIILINGVMNYLLSLIGISAQLWIFHPATVIPSLVIVEAWQWTPFTPQLQYGHLP